VRKIVPKDQSSLKDLIQPCQPVEWEHSGLSVHDKHLFGCFLDGRLVAVAGNILWDPNTVNPGVITHPDHRGKGYGTAVVSAAVQRAIKHDHLVLYQTLLANTPAVKIAHSLGFQPYAQHVAVIFKPV
jgi:predicted GNAT family acetyltransferase